MKRGQGLGVLALMALSATAGWVLLVPRPVAYTPVVVTAARPDTAAQALSLMAWPRPAAEALGDAAASARPTPADRVPGPGGAAAAMGPIEATGGAAQP